MPSSAAPSPETLDRLLTRLNPAMAVILQEWEIPEAEAEELVGEILIRLLYRWSRIPDPEQWALAALESEARSRSERKEPADG